MLQNSCKLFRGASGLWRNTGETDTPPGGELSFPQAECAQAGTWLCAEKTKHFTPMKRI